MQQENRRILEMMRAEEDSARRRAVRTSWVLVLLAALVLAGLIFVGQRRVDAVSREVDVKRDSVETLNAQIANLEPLVENYRATLVGDSVNLPADTLPADTGGAVVPGPGDLLQPFNQRTRPRPERPVHVPGFEAKARAEQPQGQSGAQPADEPAPPPPPRAPARVYLHVLREEDRAHADAVGRRLEASGFQVLGVEHVRRAAPLMNTELRYYKQADEADAAELLAALKAAGEGSAAMLYLGLERSTRVPARTYEVWFAPGARPGPASGTSPGRVQGRRPGRVP